MRRVIVLIFALAVFGIVLALALENLQAVAVCYLFGTVTMPLAAILATVLVLGALVGALAAVPAVLKARTNARRSRNELARAQEEIDNLRRAPLRDAR
ncbi:MAG: LapA family protein [Gammaproteobacteria bacterium]